MEFGLTFYVTNLICANKILSENHWLYGLWPSSGILTAKKHNVSELDMFQSLREWRETPTLLYPLEKPNLNHWTN
jgi:hypothetical protein